MNDTTGDGVVAKPSPAQEALIRACERVLDAFEESYSTWAEMVISEVERRLGHNFGPLERPNRLAEAERALRIDSSKSSLAMLDALDELKRTTFGVE